uniref:Uncharacterized protein n=1 Tax=Arundo donax TaxID=35708 RepID=A0A0A8YHV9_ARUDO
MKKLLSVSCVAFLSLSLSEAWSCKQSESFTGKVAKHP